VLLAEKEARTCQEQRVCTLKRVWIMKRQRKRTREPEKSCGARVTTGPTKGLSKVKVFQSENFKFPCPKLRFLRPALSKVKVLSPDSVKVSKNDPTKQPSVELWQGERGGREPHLKIGRWKQVNPIHPERCYRSPPGYNTFPCQRQPLLGLLV
jgi:hypothetical protein